MKILLAEDDGAGNVFAAGRETPYYDPADGWGDNWASNGD